MTLRERLGLSTTKPAPAPEPAPASANGRAPWPERPAQPPLWIRRARDPRVSPNGLAKDLTGEPIL